MKHTEETKRKISESHKGKKRTPFSDSWKRNISLGKKGMVFSLEHREKLSKAAKKRNPNNDIFEIQKKAWEVNRGRKVSKETRKKMSEAHCGEKSYMWIKDRTKLVKRQERNDSAYCAWRMEVYRRDIFKCGIKDSNCSGRIVAHHILGWSGFPELRYEVNNGITLCQFHHPLKRNDEKRLSPHFQELVKVKVL